MLPRDEDSMEAVQTSGPTELLRLSEKIVDGPTENSQGVSDYTVALSASELGPMVAAGAVTHGSTPGC